MTRPPITGAPMPIWRPAPAAPLPAWEQLARARRFDSIPTEPTDTPEGF